MTRVLFITWDGDAQNYLSSLFMPIFARLQGIGVDVEILQFSFGAAERIEESRLNAERVGLHFEHRSLPSRFRTGLLPGILPWGARAIARHAKRRDIDFLMPRSLMPASMVLLARAAGLKTPVVFDADGLMADERVDFGGWSDQNILYRTLKWVESHTLGVAEASIVRTSGARRILEAQSSAGRGNIHVVPNLVDEEVFRPVEAADKNATRRELNIEPDELVIVSVGSLGPQYVPELQASLVAQVAARVGRLKWVVLTGHAAVAEEAARGAGIAEEDLRVLRVAPDKVPAIVAASDVGLALRRPSFSQAAVCPIKIGEYMLCGTPVVANRGVGDVEAYLDGTGFVASSLAPDALATVAADISDAWATRSLREQRSATRAMGVSTFALSRADELYRDVFKPRVRKEK